MIDADIVEDAQALGTADIFDDAGMEAVIAVSYTHLDVYKRQELRQIASVSGGRRRRAAALSQENPASSPQ